MPSTPALESVLPAGNLLRWRSGYWKRLKSDSSLPDDEKIYALMDPAVFASSKKGCLAVYRHGESFMIEACVDSARVRPPLYCAAKFDPVALCASLEAFSVELHQKIRNRVDAQPPSGFG